VELTCSACQSKRSTIALLDCCTGNSTSTGAMKSCCILYDYLPPSETQENETRFTLTTWAYFSEPPLVQHQVYYSTRASHSRHLHYLSGHTCQYLSSFFPQSVRMWNELPASLPCCNSISTFKCCLCKHFVIGYA